MAKNNDKENPDSLIDSLLKLTGQVAGGTLDFAKNSGAMTAVFGEGWLRTALSKTMEPERLEAMADAGRFLQDARETAGLSLNELGESLGLADDEVLKDVESGEKIMPLELMLRSASLLARHDPIPFLIKFMRTYNPSLGETLEQWGVLSLPKNYERERRFVNLYRQHDALRTLSDEEYARFNEYMDSSISLVLDVMLNEKKAAEPPAAETESANKAGATSPKPKKKAGRKSPAKTGAKSKAKARSKSRSSRSGSKK